MGALVACGVFAGSSAVANAGTRIVAPKNDRFVKSSTTKVVVRTQRNSTSFRVWQETKNVTGSFERRGRRWVAHLPVHAGPNHVYVKTKTADGKSDFKTTRFIGARSEAPGLVGSAPVRVSQGDAPAVGTFTRAERAEAHVRLNGSSATRAFGQQEGQQYLGRLGANDGVRYGRNRLKVTVFDQGGGFDVESRDFRISRRLPIAGAGRDRNALVGEPVKLNGRASKLPGDGKRVYSWRVVSSPNGSAAKASESDLKGSKRSRPVFRARRPGTYEVQVKVRARGSHRASVDTAVVDVAPDDPPIGAPIEVYPSDGVGVVIDGLPVDGTRSSGNTLSYALLSRATRMPPGPSCRSSVPFTGAVPFGVEGIQTIEKLVNDCNSPNYILILRGPHGVDPAAADEFDALLAEIGGDPMSDYERGKLTSGRAFSVIGIPDAPGGSAFTNFTGGDGGEMRGYLEVSTATKEYGFVFPNYQPFDTQVSHSGDSNTMKIAGQTFSASTPDLAGGFQTVVLNPYNLQPSFGDASRAWETSGLSEEEDQAAQQALASYIQTKVIDEHRILFMESIGHPEVTSPAWNDIATKIAKLGGSQTVFNQLDYHDDYAFVGGPGIQPAEASTTLVHADTGAHQPGRLQGLLSRNRSGNYEPTVSDPAANVVQGLLPTIFAFPRQFEPFQGGQFFADAYFTRMIFGDKAWPLDMRAHYYLSYGENWDGYYNRIHDAPYTDQCLCSPDDFNAVKTQLLSEINDLRDVKTWISRLQSTANPTQDLFNLSNISLNIQKSVSPPDTQTSANGSTMMVLVLAVASEFLEGPEGTAASIVATLMGTFAGDQSAGDGSELLGDIQAKTTDLGSQLLSRYTLANSALTGLGRIIVSDPDKLKTVAAAVKADGSGWKLPSDLTPLSTTQNLGAKRWFYTELMPVAWARWELPGVNNARDWYCYGKDPNPEVHPWSSAPDSAQYKAVTGFTDSGGVIRDQSVVRALGIRRIDAFIDGRARNGGARPPDASMTDPLFKTPVLDPNSSKLGLYPQQFYEENFEPMGPRGLRSQCGG